MAKDDDDAYTYTYKSVLESRVAGEYAWWRDINTLPDPANAEAIRQTIRDDAAVYKELGYVVSLNMTADGDNADLHVDHPRSRPSTPARVSVLKGALCGTIERTRWGGSH